MSDLFSGTPSEPLKQDNQRLPLQENIDRLKRQLHGFSVRDKDGKQIGEVTDVVLDTNQHLCLVIRQPNPNGAPRSFLLFSRLIGAVSNRTRSITMTISQDNAHLLPKAPPVRSRSSVPSTPTQILISESDEQPTPKVLAGESEATMTPAENHEAIAFGNSEAHASLATSKAKASDPVQPMQVAQSEPLPYTGNAPVRASTSGSPDDVSFPLLEEQLRVNYNRRKIGEVIVRKTVETRMVEVPVRYEKLLIEQISPDHKPLAEVNLSQGDIPGLDEVTITERQPLVRGEFTSPRVAGQILDAIAKTLHHHCKSVRIELELDDPALIDTYQEWFNQYAQRTSGMS